MEAERNEKAGELIDKGLKEFINETAQSEQFKIPSSNMETFSNKLTDAQIERLAILVEECGEVQQIIGKIIRHGYESYNPFDPQKTTNKRLLQKEVGDLLLAVELLTRSNDLDVTQIAWSNIDKREKIKPYLHHQTNQ